MNRGQCGQLGLGKQFPDPFDLQAVVTRLNAFSSHATTDEIGIDLISVNDPKVAGLG